MNDNRECFQNTAFDRTVSRYASAWRLTCGGNGVHNTVLPATFDIASITSPPTYSIHRTILPGACDLVRADCQDEIAFLDACSSYYKAPVRNDPNFCSCQPREIQLASRCTYDANISCFGKPADMRRLDIYKSCDLSKVTPWFALAQAPAQATGYGAGLIATRRIGVTEYATVQAPGATATGAADTSQTGGVRGSAVRSSWISHFAVKFWALVGMITIMFLRG